VVVCWLPCMTDNGSGGRARHKANSSHIVIWEGNFPTSGTIPAQIDQDGPLGARSHWDTEIASTMRTPPSVGSM
jgi:hypothetical protein